MPVRRFRPIVAAVFSAVVLASGAVLARDNGFELSCDAATPAAVTTVPAPFDGIARVLCTRSGHLIVAREGWDWILPGDRPMVVLAADPRAVRPGDDIGHAAHFRVIRSLDGTETGYDSVTERIHAVLPQHAGVPLTGLRGLGLVTADGRRLILWFFHGPRDASGHDLWGMLCGDVTCAYDRETLTGLPFKIKFE